MVILSLLTITTPVSYTFSFFPINSASFSVLCRYLLFFVLHLFFFPLLSFPFAFRRFCCLKLSIDFLTGSRFWSFNHFFFFCWEMSVYIIYLLFNILCWNLKLCFIFMCHHSLLTSRSKKKKCLLTSFKKRTLY